MAGEGSDSWCLVVCAHPNAPVTKQAVPSPASHAPPTLLRLLPSPSLAPSNAAAFSSPNTQSNDLAQMIKKQRHAQRKAQVNRCTTARRHEGPHEEGRSGATPAALTTPRAPPRRLPSATRSFAAALSEALSPAGRSLRAPGPQPAPDCFKHAKQARKWCAEPATIK